MIRRIAFKKAIVAGALGAAAWEAAARLLIVGGFQVFDIVHTLGSLIFGESAPAWQWWPVGMIMHCTVGAVWAIFYAYFFWSTFDRRPVIQGIMFSVIPAVLAGTVMVPQMELMLDGRGQRLGVFAYYIGAGGPAMIIFGHLIHGAVLGSMYVRPIGYPVGKRVPLHG